MKLGTVIDRYQYVKHIVISVISQLVKEYFYYLVQRAGETWPANGPSLDNAVIVEIVYLSWLTALWVADCLKCGYNGMELYIKVDHLRPDYIKYSVSDHPQGISAPLFYLASW